MIPPPTPDSLGIYAPDNKLSRSPGCRRDTHHSRKRKDEEAIAAYFHRDFVLVDTHLHVTKVLPRTFDSSLDGIVMVHHFASHVPHLLSMHLSPGAKRILTSPNAGGSSLWSEVLSFEILHLLFNAELQFTEMELDYWPMGKITDFSVRMWGEIMGVSVTRAQKYRNRFAVEDAIVLLQKKLNGVIESSAHVSNSRWGRQILHVFVERRGYLKPLRAAYEQLPSNVRHNTICLFTVADSRRRSSGLSASCESDAEKRFYPAHWVFWDKRRSYSIILEQTPPA